MRTFDTDLYEAKKEKPTDAEPIDTSSAVTDSSTAPEVQPTDGKEVKTFFCHCRW